MSTQKLIHPHAYIHPHWSWCWPVVFKALFISKLLLSDQTFCLIVANISKRAPLSIDKSTNICWIRWCQACSCLFDWGRAQDGKAVKVHRKGTPSWAFCFPWPPFPLKWTECYGKLICIQSIQSSKMNSIYSSNIKTMFHHSYVTHVYTI